MPDQCERNKIINLLKGFIHLPFYAVLKIIPSIVDQ
jgi:hypothetical protein